MPKNKVSDPITDQEMAFARLVLSGTMTDRQAAEAVGLNPDSAAYTKSKPHVRAYILDHRAAVEQQLVQQEADGLRRLNLDRERVLDRLWEIANLSPEMTRGSITGQVKAITMIIAMQNFIPDRRAVSAEKKSAPAPVNAEIYASAWRRQAASIDSQPSPAPPVPACRGALQEDSPVAPACPGVPWKPKHAHGSAGEAPPDPGSSKSTIANSLSPSQVPPVTPYGPGFSFVPDATGPFSIKKDPFARRR
jgi:hypothetical protein